MINLAEVITFKDLCVLILQVSDWWEEYVYLRGRSPIMVNSNYYVMVQNCQSLFDEKILMNAMFGISEVETLNT